MANPWKIYNVYCEVAGVEVLTPEYADAERTFRKYVREYPTETVDFDVLEDIPANETVTDVAEGNHSGKRRRVMQSVPENPRGSYSEESRQADAESARWTKGHGGDGW